MAAAVRLGVNGWRIHGRRTGVARVLLNVVKHWTPELVDGRFDEVTFYTPQPIDRREIPLPETVREHVLRPAWPMLVWENLRLGPAAADDVLFCPSYSRPLLARGKTVVEMYEANLRLHPELYPLSARLLYARLYGWSVRHATLVIAATEAAREDIVRAYGVPPSRIRVVPLAPAEILKPLPGDLRVAEARERYLGASAPFFLFVGKLTARRNVPKLMEAFAQLKRRTSHPHKLLLIGLNTTGLRLDELATALGIRGDFRHVEHVPDDDLNLLYNGAEAFVMPCSYEATSLTALEAQATGTPVITVATPGLREMTGGAALLMSKAEVPELAEALARLADDAALRRELAERGLAHARRFSWERCSAETLAVLAEAGQLPAPSVHAVARRDRHGV